jgi:hypothetical protein
LLAYSLSSCPSVFSTAIRLSPKPFGRGSSFSRAAELVSSSGRLVSSSGELFSGGLLLCSPSCVSSALSGSKGGAWDSSSSSTSSVFVRLSPFSVFASSSCSYLLPGQE